MSVLSITYTQTVQSIRQRYSSCEASFEDTDFLNNNTDVHSSCAQVLSSERVFWLKSYWRFSLFIPIGDVECISFAGLYVFSVIFVGMCVCIGYNIDCFSQVMRLCF